MDPGLIVPVIRRADELSVVGLAKSANDLAERARSKKLKPDETRAGTFTITDPGKSLPYVEHRAMIVLPPQACRCRRVFA